jgi:hypothetical protein
MKSNPLFDPYAFVKAGVRTALAGDGYRVLYVGSDNKDDIARGGCFRELHEMFPASIFVETWNRQPPPGKGCHCRVVRNPAPDVAKQLTGWYPRPCGCRLIVDVSAPFWDGGTIFGAEHMPSADLSAWRGAVQKAASVADLVTLPDVGYAQHLAERFGLKTAVIPDFDPEQPELQAMAWTTAIMTARQPRWPRAVPQG